jgi:hypothetical protein
MICNRRLGAYDGVILRSLDPHNALSALVFQRDQRSGYARKAQPDSENLEDTGEENECGYPVSGCQELTTKEQADGRIFMISVIVIRVASMYG